MSELREALERERRRVTDSGPEAETVVEDLDGEPDFCPYCGRVLRPGLDAIDDVASGVAYTEEGEIVCFDCAKRVEESSEGST